MKPGWNEHVVIALATIAWADGKLADQERAGLLRAAADAGFTEEELADVEEAIKEPRSLDDLHLHRLTAIDRIFLYGTGIWLARLDGVDASEREALTKLADKLMLAERVQRGVTKAVDEVAAKGADADTFDLVALREVLTQRSTAGWPDA